MGKGGQSRGFQRQLEAMSKAAAAKAPAARPQPQAVDSLLGAMVDGNEYTSIVDKRLSPGINLLDQVVEGIVAIEQIRGRPCLLYVGNVLNKEDGGASGVDSSDDLPFREMVGKVPAERRAIDIFLATQGGSAHQISNFVNCLRARFDEVDFVLPSFCMSAGTLFALSGDRIWMTDRACLGPIDPQVPSSDGRYVPAQALLALVADLQKQGNDALQKRMPIPWTSVRLIDSLDKTQLGAAITSSQYSYTMAAQFLEQYKLRQWTTHSSNGAAVTPAERTQAAQNIAQALVSHDRWKSHGHAISRDVLKNELRLLIDRPNDQLNRAIVRAWALVHWVLEKTPIVKMLCSKDYKYARHVQQMLIQVPS